MCKECNCHNLEIGKKAPNFILDAYEKGNFKKVELKSYRGKWKLVFFYPLDFTFVCPTEILELSKEAPEFKKLNTQILVISVDSVYSHQAWCKEIGDLNFPMLSDLKKEVSMQYDCLHPDGMSLRGAYIIDPNDILQAKIVHNLPVGRNVEELKRVISAFQTGELCPVSWSKGKKTLGKA